MARYFGTQPNPLSYEVICHPKSFSAYTNRNILEIVCTLLLLGPIKGRRHSAFLDNVFGLIGPHGNTNATVVVSPLVDATRMTQFAVGNIKLHGREVAVSRDPAGRTYRRHAAAGPASFAVVLPPT